MANEWQDNEYKLIRFAKSSAGTDISDASLSAWLEANAEQFLQAEYDLNNIVMGGSHTITCKGRATGYQDSEASNSISIYVYVTSITTTGCTYVGLPYMVQNGSPRTIVFTAAQGYALPSSVTAMNCSYTWDQSTGTLVLSNPTGNPSVTVTATQITYSITTNVTNGTSSGSSTIADGGTASVTITPTTGYELPSSVTVVNATSSYNDTTGVISLSAPTGNVTITAVCQLPQLDTPTNLSVSGTTATFDEVENAESYEFYVDDVSIGEYSTQTGYTVTLTASYTMDTSLEYADACQIWIDKTTGNFDYEANEQGELEDANYNLITQPHTINGVSYVLIYGNATVNDNDDYYDGETPLQLSGNTNITLWYVAPDD